MRSSYAQPNAGENQSRRYVDKPDLSPGGGRPYFFALAGFLAGVGAASLPIASTLRLATSSASFHSAPPSAPDFAAFLRSSAADNASALAFFGSRRAAAAATNVAATTSVVIGFWAIFFAPFTTLAT